MAILERYFEVSDELGERFVASLIETLHHIAEFPRSVPLVNGRRRFRIPNFPYGVFVDADSQIVLGFRHDAQDPGRFPRMN